MIEANQAKAIREKLNEHEQARNNLFPNKCSFTPQEMDQLPPRPTNDELAQLEVYDWITNPPEKYFTYVTEVRNVPASIGTWTSLPLGIVTDYGRVVTCYTPSGGQYQKQHITVKGTNGYDYQGWYYCSTGTYARIKRIRTK